MRLKENLTQVPGTENLHPLAASEWLTQDEVLYLRRDGSSGPGVYLVNTHSGKSNYLEAISHKFPEITYTNQFGTHTSPDGQWLLWPSGDLSFWNAVKLDGSHYTRRPLSGDSFSNLTVAWLPDSQGWVEGVEKRTHLRGNVYDFSYYLYVSRLDNAKQQVIRVNKPGTQWAGCNGLWVTPNNHVLIANAWGADKTDFQDVDLNIKNAPAVTFTTNLTPHQRGPMECALSPKGDRFAWKFQTQGLLGITESVWVSNLKGTDMHQVTPELRLPFERLVCIRWTPDGKRVSFWHSKALWTVPAD